MQTNVVVRNVRAEKIIELFHWLLTAKNIHFSPRWIEKLKNISEISWRLLGRKYRIWGDWENAGGGFFEWKYCHFCRKQIRALAHVHQTDLKNIKDLLKEFKCPSCRLQTNKEPSTSSLGLKDNDASGSKSRLKSIEFNAIGEIRTEFSEKRAVPRQPTVCSKLLGRIELSKDLFTNIEHSLDGLTDFSHLWIIYHFHRNEAHAKAKVAPPRLGGQRVGIFSTRSPHRPCPIGLSLVEIDHVDGKNIYFRGTDMVDGTPVLDIKPYIPRYDNPVLDVSGKDSVISQAAIANLFITHTSVPIQTECHPKTVVENVQTFDAREEPDGEETVSSAAIAASTSTAHRLPLSSLSQSNRCDQSPGYLRDDTAGVKVPKWVLAETSLDVLFNERANQQIAELEVNRVSFK